MDEGEIFEIFSVIQTNPTVVRFQPLIALLVHTTTSTKTSADRFLAALFVSFCHHLHLCACICVYGGMRLLLLQQHLNCFVCVCTRWCRCLFASQATHKKKPQGDKPPRRKYLSHFPTDRDPQTRAE